MRTLAVVPVKRFALAKSRLSERFEPEQRAALMAAMVADVLAALVTSRELAGVLTVTNEPAVVALAERLGAGVEPDRREAGQSAAAAIGVAAGLREGYERVLLAPGDCPALDRDELDELLRAHPEPVVVVPDRHGTGTNAL
ncbi:MAG TPA: NTP transferase domain-containing protein, partial [Solirubrobacteraceae bacterium]|nr:NTP transferase domain-containing protein [Solirubrobacteraceae bacterium]